MACQITSPIIDYQIGSPLYRLPQELRDQIYSHLFASTRLSHGIRHNAERHTTSRVKPDRNALAILRACRRARYEIGGSWVGQATFHFEDQAALLDVLSGLAPAALARVRRVRVGARKLALGFPGSKFRACYGLASALKLLPGLDLDTLTVLGSAGAGGDSGSDLRHDYETLDDLVRDGSGWRELRFVSPSSAVLGYANVTPAFIMGIDDGDDGVQGRRFWRKPQPAHWRSTLNDRDGEMSEPEVTVYRSTQPGRCGSVLDESTRDTYEQEVPHGRLAVEDFGVWGDKVLLADGEREKEMMVVVRRGAGVECGEKAGSPFIRGDIRQEMGGKSWEAIRRDHIDALDEMGVVEDETEMDSYVDVDEYVWPAAPTQTVRNIYSGL